MSESVAPLSRTPSSGCFHFELAHLAGFDSRTRFPGGWRQLRRGGPRLGPVPIAVPVGRRSAGRVARVGWSRPAQHGRNQPTQGRRQRDAPSVRSRDQGQPVAVGRPLPVQHRGHPAHQLVRCLLTGRPGVGSGAHGRFRADRLTRGGWGGTATRAIGTAVVGGAIPFETARRQATWGFFLLTPGHLSRSASLLASSSAPRADVGAIPTPKPCRAVHAAIPRFNDAAYRLQDFSQQSAGAAEFRVQLRPLTMRPVVPVRPGVALHHPTCSVASPGGALCALWVDCLTARHVGVAWPSASDSMTHGQAHGMVKTRTPHDTLLSRRNEMYTFRAWVAQGTGRIPHGIHAIFMYRFPCERSGIH